MLKYSLRTVKSDASTDRCAGSTNSPTSRADNDRAGDEASASRFVQVGRVCFVFGLLLVAAALGGLAYYLIRKSETDLATSQFEAIADRALTTAASIVIRKTSGTLTMASIASAANPYAAAWPYVTITGYEEIATNQIETSDGREMGLCPIVLPDQLEEFENFAYDYFETSRVPAFPNGTAISPFGKGVWGAGPDGKYHDLCETTSYGSPNKICTPILQHNEGPHPALMINLHFQESRGTMIDDMLSCSSGSTTQGSVCAAITDMINLTSQDVQPGPGALIMQPIYPKYDNHTMVGMIASSIVWDETLQDVFASSVSGVDCVLRTETQTYTYGVQDGIPFVKGSGDLHDPAFDNTYFISLTGEGLFSNSSADYVLELYPTEEFYTTYRTSNPAIATVGAICCILVTSFFFFLYDFFVRKQINYNKHLLEAKRQYVRFISHEVRTPLNVVYMGLQLLQDGMDRISSHHQSKAPSTTVSTEPEDNRKDAMTEALPEWRLLTEDIIVNTSVAVEVLNDLLNYDKIQRGRLTLELGIVPIWTLLDQTVTEFKLMALEKHVNLKLDFSKIMDGTDVESPVVPGAAKLLSAGVRSNVVVGDEMRISQVLRNLLSNGLKFTPENGELTVTVSWEKADTGEKKAKEATHGIKLANTAILDVANSGLVVIDVTDTGVGLSEEQLNSVFNDGVQFNRNQLQSGGGSGLGLFIAKGIVEAHAGGTLSVSSPGPNLGTTFSLSLPLSHIEGSGGTETEDDSAHISSKPLEPTKLHVLVVDDNKLNRKLLIRMLTNRGHTCDEAADGDEALDRVQSSAVPFDCVLLDYEMPVRNGPSACREMRNRGCSSFIVGVTGNLMPEDVAHFKKCGADSVLPKPFKMASVEQLWVEYGISNG